MKQTIIGVIDNLMEIRQCIAAEVEAIPAVLESRNADAVQGIQRNLTDAVNRLRDIGDFLMETLQGKGDSDPGPTPYEAAEAHTDDDRDPCDEYDSAIGRAANILEFLCDVTAHPDDDPPENRYLNAILEVSIEHIHKAHKAHRKMIGGLKEKGGRCR